MDMNALTGDERKSLEDTLEAAAWLKRLLYDLDGQIGEFIWQRRDLKNNHCS